MRSVDLGRAEELKQALREDAPGRVIHCAALSAVGDCFQNPELAESLNHRACALLGELSERLVSVSTDLVFDGISAPYGESDFPRPLSVYGRSKLAGERALEKRDGVAVVRVSLLYGPAPFGGGFFQQQMEALLEGRELRLFGDEWRTPLALDDAARGLVDIALSDFCGVAHLGGPERLSRYQMGLALAKRLMCPPSLVVQTSQSDVNFPEPRPCDVSLHCETAKREWGWNPSTFAEGLERLIGNPPPSSTKR